MVLISVVLPAYNHEKYISQSIESILSQTFKDFELIIIDDKSIDRSLKIAEEYQKKDDRIKIIRHKKNEGISKSVNDGIDFAVGKYIAIACTDDIWKVDKLKKQISILKNNENLIVWNEAELINKNGKLLEKTFT
ncbi:MAG: glycosyltransferase family 2 protein, partial [Candidatus Hodarchaeota archaeon]